MKKTIAILSALFLLTQGSSMAARAGRDRIERGRMSYENRYDCSSLAANAKLKLTADQAVRLRVQDEQYAPEIDPIREQLYGKGRELKAEWLQAEPDRGKITVLQGEVAKLREMLRAKLASHRADVLTVLTPEQQAQASDEGPGRVFTKPTGFGRHQERR